MHRLFCLEFRQVTDNLYKNSVLLCKLHLGLNVYNHNNLKDLYTFFFLVKKKKKPSPKRTQKNNQTQKQNQQQTPPPEKKKKHPLNSAKNPLC